MDRAGWALFGLVATAVLTAIMITAQLAGLTRLDLPLLLGAIFTEDPTMPGSSASSSTSSSARASPSATPPPSRFGTGPSGGSAGCWACYTSGSPLPCWSQ